MKRRIGLTVLLVGILVGYGLISKGEVQAGPPQELVINHIGDITGPYAATIGVRGVMACKDVEDYVNSRGGIKGVKVKIVIHDTRNKRDVAIAKYTELAAQKPPILVIQQVADQEVLKERLAEDKIPGFGVGGTDKVNWPPGWVFQSSPPYTDQFALFLDWLRSDWKKTGKIRLAFVNPDYQYGRSHLTPEVEEYIKKKGIDVVANEFFPPFDLDATTQFTRVAAAKPDAIFSMTIATQVKVALKGAEAAGLKGVLYGMGPWGVDAATARGTGELMEGVVGISPTWVPSDTTVPLVKDIVAKFEAEKRNKDDMNVAYSILWLTNAAVIEAITKTVDRVGWDKLSGEEVYKTMVTPADYKTMGLAPFKFSPKGRCSVNARIVKITKGETVAISDWQPCPDMRPAQYK
jgi:ABC-type branched-subunit amino acid transport system substrate-binding protein